MRERIITPLPPIHGVGCVGKRDYSPTFYILYIFKNIIIFLNRIICYCYVLRLTKELLVKNRIKGLVVKWISRWSSEPKFGVRVPARPPPIKKF